MSKKKTAQELLDSCVRQAEILLVQDAITHSDFRRVAISSGIVIPEDKRTQFYTTLVVAIRPNESFADAVEASLAQLRKVNYDVDSKWVHLKTGEWIEKKDWKPVKKSRKKEE